MAAPIRWCFGRFTTKQHQRLLLKNVVCSKQMVRFKGLPPDVARSFKERLIELNQKDPILDTEINIGLPLQTSTVNIKQRDRLWRKDRKGKEQTARFRKLKIPLDTVQDEWIKESGARDVRIIAQHYGIFKDLFHNAYFHPQVPLRIFYDYDEEFVTPVLRGNRVMPSEAAVAPYVEYESEPGSLWTLALTAPDSHLQDSESEYLHWMVGNIPGSSIDQGEVLCDYLQPFPVRGTGFHRYVFVLYRQYSHINFGQERKSSRCLSLQERTFKTVEFYRSLQDILTPVGLGFFQSEWDKSVTQVFWNELEMKEPSYEFMHPPPYHPKQIRYPHKEPFNLYLDRYRDIKDIQEEVLIEKLRSSSPFKERPQRPKYPNALSIPMSTPQWLKLKIQHQRLRRHQWKDLDD